MTPDYYNKVFKGVKIDPYRIASLYNFKGGPREHILKKVLRGTDKAGQQEQELIDELRGQLDRWEQMVNEDIATAKLTRLPD